MPTEMGKSWIEQTQRRWTTEKELTTDATGKIHFRGFKGKYELIIGDQTSEFHLAADQQQRCTFRGFECDETYSGQSDPTADPRR